MLALLRAAVLSRPCQVSTLTPLRAFRATAVAAASGKGEGVVKWFNSTKGFGFITPDDGSADIFVHHTSIVNDGRFRSLADGERVEYDVGAGEDGRTKAFNVTGPGGVPPLGAPRGAGLPPSGRGRGGYGEDRAGSQDGEAYY